MQKAITRNSVMIPELTPEEREVARKLWHSLMVKNQMQREDWEKATHKVKDAVVVAMGVTYELAMCLREPVDTTCPFD